MTAPEKTFPTIGCLASSICLASAYGESSFIPLLGTFPARNACGWFLAGALSGCVKMSPSKTTLRSLCLTTELPQLRCLRLSPPNPLRWASAGAPNRPPKKTFPPMGCLASSICLASAYGESSFIPLLGTFPTRNACGWFLAGALSGCVKMLFSPKKTFPPIRSAGEWGVQPLIGLFIGPYLFR